MNRKIIKTAWVNVPVRIPTLGKVSVGKIVFTIKSYQQLNELPFAMFLQKRTMAQAHRQTRLQRQCPQGLRPETYCKNKIIYDNCCKRLSKSPENTTSRSRKPGFNLVFCKNPEGLSLPEKVGKDIFHYLYSQISIRSEYQNKWKRKF